MSTTTESDRDLLVSDLLDSVRDYRDPTTTFAERAYIQRWWDQFGISNQFQAMLIAAAIGKGDTAE